MLLFFLNALFFFSFSFSIGKKYLTYARGDFCVSVVPVISVSDRLYCTLNGCKSLVLFSLFTTGSVFWGYMSNVSVYDVGLHFFLFSYTVMKTLFLHSVFLWMLTCFCTVFSFIYTRVRVRGDGRECVCVHACAHVLLWSCVSTAVSSLQVTFVLGKKT